METVQHVQDLRWSQFKMRLLRSDLITTDTDDLPPQWVISNHCADYWLCVIRPSAVGSVTSPVTVADALHS